MGKWGPRDSQMSRVYMAEGGVDGGSRLETVTEMQAWVDKIMRSVWWKNRYSYITYIQVMPGRGCKCALASWSKDRRNPRGTWIPSIKIPIWARYQFTILHEMAHHVTNPTRFKDAYASHGPEFCWNFLALVKRWMGAADYADLRSKFRECKVRVKRA